MPRLALYDPPMCCSTGVCGPVIDPVLPRIAADLDWLKRQGVDVERYNLAQQPQAFATNAVVTAALRAQGNDCLPLVVVDGQVASLGSYPTRTELARLVGLQVEHQSEKPTEVASSCCSNPNVADVVGGPNTSCRCC